MSSILQRGCSFGRRSLALAPRYLLLQYAKGAPKRCIFTAKAKTKPFGPISVFLLVVPCGTFCLGTWQYQRRQWKLNLIAELEARTSAPPVEFPEDLNDLEDLEYKRVRLRGTFDHSKEIFMGPRPRLVGGDVYEGGSGLISSGQSGYLVLTPFKFADRDLTILVNRGWVSRKQRNAEARPEGQIDGVVNLTAVVRKTENRAPFMPDNTKGSLLFTFRDVERMSQMTGTSPICVDAVDTFPGGPQGGQTRVTLRNEHLSYMFTWYSLSIATAYMWYHRFLRGKPLM
ncbi:surfeit locus protein 1-like [Macrobrachium nipponense]|uniref:surfeit locus protein 1-like n=1 Tax=Macrobrachium nipponense TaxID=159736 RepID=UPI0030C83901